MPEASGSPGCTRPCLDPMRVATLSIVPMLLVAAGTASPQEPIPIEVHVEAIGRGEDGTAVALTVQIQPEDRALVGECLEVRTTISTEGEIVEDISAPVVVDEAGSATVSREWLPGSYDLEVMASSCTRAAVGWSPWTPRVR